MTKIAMGLASSLFLFKLVKMDRLLVDIFIPEKKRFRLTPNWIVYGLWAVVIAFLWLFENVFPVNSISRIIILCIVIVVDIYYLVRSFFTYEPLKGVIKGHVLFKSDSIVVNEKVYNLKSITNLDFAFNDYYGRMRYLHGNFDPLLSQGVGNFVEFKDNSQQTIRIYFRMQGKHGAQSFYSFINDAVHYGAMSYYRAIDLIDVENVTKPVLQ